MRYLCLWKLKCVNIVEEVSKVKQPSPAGTDVSVGYKSQLAEKVRCRPDEAVYSTDVVKTSI